MKVEAIRRDESSIVVDIALVGTGWDVAANNVAAVMEEGENGGWGSGNGREKLSTMIGFVVVGKRTAPNMLCTNAIFEAVEETACDSCYWEIN